MSTMQLSRNEVKELLRNGYGLSQKKETGIKAASVTIAIVINPVVVAPQWPIVSPVFIV